MEKSHMAMFVICCMALAAVVGARVVRVAEKSHYTDVHHALHSLVKRTTHSHLEDFEIAIPELVDVSGSYVTHSFARRSRRNAEDAPDQPIVKLYAHGHNFHVALVPNNVLLAPNFAVKRVRRDAATGELKEEEETSPGLDCHYRGRMVSHENRTTAISMCDGMSGLLRTEEDDFIVEPVAPHLQHDFPHPQHPHIVYKRKHLGNGQKLHYCGKRKRHPMAISADETAEIRHLSDGAIVLKSPEERKIEYATPPAFDDVDSPPREFSPPSSRRKRSTIGGWYGEEPARRRVVETLVVADKALLKNHESDRVDVTTYILTVMNMVTGLFKDNTLDGQIDIVLVGLTLLEEDKELLLDHRADKSLSNFCQWQSKANTTTGRKPDHSILLTGIDICIDKNQPCDTLGLAQIGGMCSHSDSCTINEDMGLGLAFTVAHETGHSFSMKHDSQGNSCSKRGGHIMSPTLNTLNGVFTWSSCSRKSLQEFLRSDYSRCLDDSPTAIPDTKYLFPEELPGQMYTANDQCRLQFGAGAQLCYFRYLTSKKSICKALWCQRSDGVCETKYMPAVEGTSCGRGLWCRRGECVPQSSSGPKPIDGGWSDYGEWSECSRTCGGGVTFKRRLCDNPVPRYGGRYCEGEDKIYKLCNTQICAPGTIDYRAEQCGKYNSRPYRRQYFTWVPYKKYWKYDFNKCELLCEAEGYGFFDMLAPQVEDGTSCDDASDDVCIAGQCVHVGCDHVLNSNATVDACGICNGDNSTCKFVKGTFADNIPDSGYYHVTRIPQGARTIRIKEDSCCTHTYIAVKSASHPTRYYLNGNWRVDLYGEMKFAGASWKYERQILQRELLTAEGPLTEDIIVEALIVRKNPGISYSYAVKEIDNRLPYNLREEITEPPPAYTWHKEYSTCTKTCAGGQQTTSITCLQDDKRPVNNSFCNPSTKPPIEIKECNTHNCPARWVTEEWGQCSRTCGGGLQTRRVTCKQTTVNGEEYAPPNECNLSQKPSRNQVCNHDECPPRWKVGQWSRCSKVCGRGVRTRRLTCESGTRRLANSKCNQEDKPIYRQSCLASFCRKHYQWFITPWGQCTTTCGEGQQQRELRCTFKGRNGRYKPVNTRKCRRTRKPSLSLSKPCSNEKCPVGSPKFGSGITASAEANSRPHPSIVSRRVPARQHPHLSSESKWIATAWRSCSVTCAGGKQVRTVRCLLNNRPSSNCDFAKQPSSVRSCSTYQCPTATRTDDLCEDKFSWCHLVPQHNTCSHSFFGKKCCKSCRNTGGS